MASVPASASAQAFRRGRRFTRGTLEQPSFLRNDARHAASQRGCSIARSVERAAAVLPAVRVAFLAVLDAIEDERVPAPVVDLVAKDAEADDAHLAVSADVVERIGAGGLVRFCVDT